MLQPQWHFKQLGWHQWTTWCIALHPVIMLCTKLDAEGDWQAAVISLLLTTLGNDRCTVVKLFLVQRLSHRVCNQATECAIQHIWCLSHARINWTGCVRKDILHKNGRDGRGGGTNLSEWGGSPSGLFVHLPVLSLFCTRKTRRWQNVPSGALSAHLGCVCVCQRLRKSST